jgi:flagellin-like hook-associated protein FlgL
MLGVLYDGHDPSLKRANLKLGLSVEWMQAAPGDSQELRTRFLSCHGNVSVQLPDSEGRDMSARRIAAIALTGALVAGGAGAAFAAISKDDDKKAEQSILDNAAKRLNVTPDALRSALAAAQDEQLDQAVKDGLLTQTQADAIKARRKQDGRVLGGPFGEPGARGFGPGGPRGPRFGHHRGGHMLFEDLAKALDLTPAKLFAQLRAGKSIADVAKAQGKSLDSVRSAVKAAAKARADTAVKSGDITQAQADEMLSRLDDALQNLDKAKPFAGRRDFREGPPRLRGGGGNRPGSFVPAPSPDGIFF